MNGNVVKAHKTVGGCGEPKAQVMAQLRLATRALQRPDEDTSPKADTNAGSGLVAMTGAPLVLDGCKSRDEEFDTFTAEWRNSGPGAS